ncbi:uncharacterized protein LOC131680546 [Topomyia yanbarensis]|uniref:uncharacterized protein LOC131680546 n=1 Tax=Topomyia yanbarensis TaxID=2498891 RepID=UPI00273C8D9A|nr:uncharacterized protein LOC131680546 [Topomyia yanbarensis]
MDPGYYKVTEASENRPDVAAVVGILRRKGICPSVTDWTEAKRIVRYLIHTVDYGSTLGRSGRELLLLGCCDADLAGDSSDRKPCTGYMFSLGGATMTWVSRKQNCVAMSIMEAEYVALSEVTQEVGWLRHLPAELNEKQQREYTPSDKK